MWKYEETRNFRFFPWPKVFIKGEILGFAILSITKILILIRNIKNPRTKSADFFSGSPSMIKDFFLSNYTLKQAFQKNFIYSNFKNSAAFIKVFSPIFVCLAVVLLEIFKLRTCFLICWLKNFEYFFGWLKLTIKQLICTK